MARRSRSRSRSPHKREYSDRYDRDRGTNSRGGLSNNGPQGRERRTVSDSSRDNSSRADHRNAEEARTNEKKTSKDFSSLMIGALAGKPKNRRGGNADASDDHTGRGEVWGKPEDFDSKQGGAKKGGDDQSGEANEKPKVKADFGLSGVLATDEVTGNVLNGIVLKFTEPADARVPPIKGKKWRFYVFKGDDLVETLHLHKQSAYLVGREKEVCDIYLRHPSLSKQHAVVQFRGRNYVDEKMPHAPPRVEILPYIMDLGSTNGTFLNKEKIEPQRYYQLLEKDTLCFGESTREFVVLSDAATDE